MISVFDLFKPGIGPSSSHTMGPMTAAGMFLDALTSLKLLAAVRRVTVTLYGSLAFTGRGHATDRAVMLGLMGYEPATLDPDEAEAAIALVSRSGRLALPRGSAARLDMACDFCWRLETHPSGQPNTLSFEAFGAAGPLLSRTYHSIGGGTVVNADCSDVSSSASDAEFPHPYTSGATLLAMTAETGLSIAGLMLVNEVALRPEAEVLQGLDAIATAMDVCIDRGLRMQGVLPGGLGVPRRARSVHHALLEKAGRNAPDPLAGMDWLNLWALAVNEENAAGARVVTAPTNGAAGIVPSVLRYHMTFGGGTTASRRTFLLAAAAIGGLYKRNASISGAEVGCQGEVGVACSMAAAGLAAACDADNAQVENAAEIAMEHNLGLTCDPIAGLVQIPCIERNAIGAVKAVDAARLALLGDGRHVVSLDKAIATMKRTGADMNRIYKETSLGGLAVNTVEC